MSALETQKQATEIVIENLSLAYGATEVLKGIDLKIEPGEFFAFLGPSGSGKSTLLRSIAGFGPEPKGNIRLGGNEVSSLPPWKRNVGLVFQNYALWPHMTVFKNVAFGLEERKVPQAEISVRVKEALELVGLLDYAERYPSALSGGQQQRVALARTIVIEPKVLLLDEPLSNLDANLRVQMRQELLRLQRRLGLTTIFVTHDQEEANTICDRIAVLEDGILQQVGSPDELYDNPKNKFVAKFLGTANILDGHYKPEGNCGVFRSKGGQLIKLPMMEISGNALLVFRPQAVTLVDASSESTNNNIRMSGIVKFSEFLGNTVRYSIDVGGEEILVDDIHLRGGGRQPTGTVVALDVSETELVVLPAS